ncbi:hypothetical protein J6590_036376 [Homalodisca vitripennis]|nr:hypothetical protein J6590_036376 [Homalodisca vitripennis]
MLPNRADTVRSERPPAVLWVIRVPGVLNTTGLLGPWCADTMGLVDCAMLPSRADTVRSERPRRSYGSSEFLVGKWQLARLVVEALGGLSASPAAARKAEVVPDTLIAVPPMLPPPPPPSSLPPSLPPPPPPPSLSPSLPPPPPPPPSPPPSDSIQLTPGPPMPTISCDDAVKEDERNGPVVHSAASNLQEQRIETAFLGTPL